MVLSFFFFDENLTYLILCYTGRRQGVRHHMIDQKYENRLKNYVIERECMCVSEIIRLSVQYIIDVVLRRVYTTSER